MTTTKIPPSKLDPQAKAEPDKSVEEQFEELEGQLGMIRDEMNHECEFCGHDFGRAPEPTHHCDPAEVRKRTLASLDAIRLKPRTTVKRFAADLKSRIARSAVSFDQDDVAKALETLAHHVDTHCGQGCTCSARPGAKARASIRIVTRAIDAYHAREAELVEECKLLDGAWTVAADVLAHAIESARREEREACVAELTAKAIRTRETEGAP